MKQEQIKAEIIKATRGIRGSTNGLITVKVEMPLFLWTELLTHRRFSRNASSARAMSTDRYTGMGYYCPDIFYSAAQGMQSSNTPIKFQGIAKFIWRQVMKSTLFCTKVLEKIGNSKEQRNRLIPPTKMIHGIVTGTEDAWKWFLTLRRNEAADKAMQEFASIVANLINKICWDYDDSHIPYDPLEGSIEQRVKVAAARISRVSYAKFEGKDDIVSANRLIEQKHYSPFEHIAFFTKSPGISAVFCKKADSHIQGTAYLLTEKGTDYGWLFGYGWKSWRTKLEEKA